MEITKTKEMVSILKKLIFDNEQMLRQYIFNYSARDLSLENEFRHMAYIESNIAFYRDALISIIYHGFNNKEVKSWLNKLNINKGTNIVGTSKEVKHFNKAFGQLDFKSMYVFYYLQNALIKTIENHKTISIDFYEDFVSLVKKPNINDIKLSLTRDYEYVRMKEKLTETDLLILEQFVEENLIDPSIEVQDFVADRVFVGYTQTGVPLYAKNTYSRKKFVGNSSERYFGKTYGINEDNSPKEYLEPKGYEDLPYETEKDM